MPFVIISAPSVVHRGKLRRDEQFVVEMTTGSRLVFDMTRDRDRQPRFRLLQSAWTKPVTDAVDQMTKELNRRGRPPNQDDFMALLAVDEIIAIGQPIILTIMYGRTAHGTRDVRLRGTPKQFPDIAEAKGSPPGQS